MLRRIGRRQNIIWSSLIRSEDPAADRRRMIVAEFREKHDGAAERIAARLKKRPRGQPVPGACISARR